MSELKKEGASTAQPKANTSLLDEEIGKEFLNSWNAGVDALDFNSETVPQSKKKPFNFDKLDMDFGLDGGFDKISSFTIDMSDLDFSSPPRKAEKPKERSGKESVPGKQERKEDSFTFSFDFKELDGFDLDSSLVKGGKESDKCTNDKGLPSFISSGSSQESINNSTSNIDTLENFDIKKLKKLDGLTSNLVPPSASQDMDTATNDVPSVTQKHGNQDVLHYANSPEKRTNTFAMENRLECQEAMQHREQPETTGSKEPCVQHSIKDIAVQSVSIEDSVLVSASELQTEAAIISLSRKEDNNVKAVPSSFTPELQTGPAVTSLSRKADNNVKAVPSSPFQDSCPIIKDNLEHLSPICMTQLKDTDAEFQKYSESHNHAMEGNDAGKETANSDTDFEDVSLRNVSQKLHDVSASGDKPNLVMKDQLPVDRESTVDKLSPLKGKGIGVIRSKYFNKSGDTETTLLSASAPKKVYALCNKKLEGLHLGHADQRSLKIGGSEEEPRNHMVGISESNTGGLKKGLPLKMGNSSSDKLLNTSGFQIHLANSSEPSSMYSTPKSKNPELEVSSEGPLRNSSPFSVHIHKASSLKPNVKSFDVSGLSAASTMASKREPSDSFVQKEIRSLRQPEENRGMHVNMASKVTNSVSSIAPIRSSKYFSVDKNKASPLNPNAAPLNIHILNATSTLTSKGEPVHSAFHKEVRSLKKPDGSMGMHVSIESKMAHSSNKEQTPSYSSLKRKSLEEPCPGPVNLNPLKRIMESSSESREDRNASKRTEEKMPTALLEACPDASIAGLEVPATALLEACPDASIAGLEVPVLLESNGKVEKAEACEKELEAIYNILKRKHNEAKEVLVRTIVNNNLLLMLNHPAYEEKIQTIQRFAASLLSKDHQP